MHYFDNAATTFPKPNCVYHFMNNFYKNFAGNAGRGENQFSQSSSKLIFETRKKIQKLLHCETKQVIFTPSATISLNMILQGLILSNPTKIKNIYISPFEHNAVTRVLHHFEMQEKIKVFQLSMNKQSLQYDFERIKYQFDEVKPDLMIVSHASNVIGLISPVKELCHLAKNYEATTIIDMAQTCGLVDLDCSSNEIDFVVFAGHKTLYGPTGIGGFVKNPNVNLEPILFGGTGFDSVNPNMPTSIPERYEMGTQNIVGIAGFYAALCWIEEIGLKELWQKECENRKRLIKIFENYDFVKIIGNVAECEYVGIVSVLLDGIPSDSAESIFNECGIAIRSGLQCSPLAHKFLGTSPAGTVRFSTGYFTSEDDFEQLENCLEYIEQEM